MTVTDSQRHSESIFSSLSGALMTQNLPESLDAGGVRLDQSVDYRFATDKLNWRVLMRFDSKVVNTDEARMFVGASARSHQPLLSWRLVTNRCQPSTPCGLEKATPLGLIHLWIRKGNLKKFS